MHVFDLHRAFLHLRNTHSAFRPESRETWARRRTCLRRRGDPLPERRKATGSCSSTWRAGIVSRSPVKSISSRAAGRRWHKVLSSNESRFGGTLAESFDLASQSVSFEKPEVLVLEFLP